MGALLRLLVAGRIAARVRMQARLLCLRAVAGTAIAGVAAIGVGFLLVAAYQALRQHWAPPLPAVFMGVGLLLIAAVLAIAVHLAAQRIARRTVAASPAIDPALASIGALAGKVPPALMVAAVAGFLYGIGRSR